MLSQVLIFLVMKKASILILLTTIVDLKDTKYIRKKKDSLLIIAKRLLDLAINCLVNLSSPLMNQRTRGARFPWVPKNYWGNLISWVDPQDVKKQDWKDFQS
jgi:hypothetical protein